MPRIRHVSITNFRCLKSFSWHPSPGFNCLIGAGDAGKSTVLDAIDLCLGARRSTQFSDADFHDLNVLEPIAIAVTVGELEESMKQFEAFGVFLRGYRLKDSSIEDEPDEGEHALTILLTVTGDLEPAWTLYSDRAAAQNQTRVLSWSDRIRLAPTWIGDYASHHLSWRKGSVLNRLSDERADLTATLAKVAREARSAFGDSAGKQLTETLGIVSKTATELGVATGTAKALLGADAVSFVAGTVSLHSEAGVPLSSLGLGSARLLVAGLQRSAATTSTVLIDELEHGLEPHRIIRLIDRLGAKEDPAPLQVFATTHSPAALRELSGDQLFILRDSGDLHECARVGTADALQGAIRTHPEAFLASSVVICEGATEVGLLRGLDRWYSDRGSIPLTARGVVLVDGGGVTRLVGRAEALRSLGFRTMIFRDDDKQPDPEAELQYLNAGGATTKWRDGYAFEDELFASVSNGCAVALLEHALELHGEAPIDEHIKSASNGALQLRDCRGICDPAQRGVLGRAARSGDGWFKTVGRMETVATEILGPNLVDTTAAFQAVVDGLLRWSAVD